MIQWPFLYYFYVLIPNPKHDSITACSTAPPFFLFFFVKKKKKEETCKSGESNYTAGVGNFSSRIFAYQTLSDNVSMYLV